MAKVICADRNSLSAALWKEKIMDEKIIQWFEEINLEKEMNLPLPEFLCFSTLNNCGNIKHFIAGWFCSTNSGKSGITLSIEYYEGNGEEQIKKTLLHEMVHYWCWFNRIPFKDTDLDFAFFLGKFGSRRHCDYPEFTPKKRNDPVLSFGEI